MTKRCYSKLFCLVLLGYNSAYSLPSDYSAAIDHGKSTVINNTAKTIKLDYKSCSYDYNKKSGLSSNIICEGVRSFELLPHKTVDFSLSAEAPSGDMTHLHTLYIGKISSGALYQNFITDPADLNNYTKYLKSPTKGVKHLALSCYVTTSYDTHIYLADRSFLCVR